MGVDWVGGFVVDCRDDLRCAAWEGVFVVVEDVVDDAAVGDALGIRLDWVRVQD